MLRSSASPRFSQSAAISATAFMIVSSRFVTFLS
jgi:hypothetical protein